jgi:hypothetical protein
LKTFSVRIPQAPGRKYRARLKNLAWEEHSNLFKSSISVEEKKLYQIASSWTVLFTVLQISILIINFIIWSFLHNKPLGLQTLFDAFIKDLSIGKVGYTKAGNPY